ncbi:MAG: sigma-54 factor interaction domain-containing protein, partial [Deltaproteobacteria bacterium]
MTRDDHDFLDTETFQDLDQARRGPSGRRAVTLTVLGHPQAARVGARARLPEAGRLELSRSVPTFDGAPLLTPSISRRPVVVERVGARLRLDPTGSSTAVRLDGDAIDVPVTLDPARLAAGVVVELGEQVVLLLHEERVDDAPPPDFGMVGDSDGIREVRAAVARYAQADGPVLIRGETGTGKELVARALHAAGPRRSAPWLAVNMAAIPAGVAASELFGHARGAFSGAREARDGFFARADGGTLFMDEIGATPPDVQAALLRALETGEIQPVGARALRQIDVRLVAATDLDLDAAMRAERFRAPLYYRLATREVVVPPLRERRADVGRLLVSFLREALAPGGRAALLDPPLDQREVWLPGRLVARLARHTWPGNVR